MLSMVLEKQISYSPLRLIICLTFLLASSYGLAQGSAPSPTASPSPSTSTSTKTDSLTEEQKLLRDLKKNFSGERKLLEKYFQKKFLDRIGGLFEDSLNTFGDEDFDSLRKSFEEGFQGFGAGLNNRWIKDKEGMILLIDGAVAQGGNFDLNVKNGQVSIKGSLQKDLGQMGKRVMSFNNTFPVPVGTDPDKVRVENAKDGLRVIFPWKNGAIQKKKNSKKTPIKKGPNDITI